MPMARILKNRRGQTSVEYLLLLALVFITAYIILTQPLATFTTQILNNIVAGMQNLIRNAELSSGSTTPGTPGSPGFKALHL